MPVLEKPASLATAYAERAALAKEIDERQKEHAGWLATASQKVAIWNEVIAQHKSGLDAEKIALARTILKVEGLYEKAGQDRASVISDAIAWFATGKAPCYYQLSSADYGTKSYDRWHGQRSDHEWGGPRHGSLIFKVGLRDRKAEITPEQREACLYYLTNITEIQEAASAAKQAA
jgi:hypothetical protein